MSKREMLMDELNRASFALDDIILFLDTHPCDKEALHYYHHCVEKREKAMKAYTDIYGPLQIEQVEGCEHWHWVHNPWPWEKGGNC